MVFPFGRICNSVNTVSLFTQTSEVCGGEQVEPLWRKILSEGVFQFLKIIYMFLLSMLIHQNMGAIIITKVYWHEKNPKDLSKNSHSFFHGNVPLGGFICTFSLLISLSITLRTSKFRNQFTISSKYFELVSSDVISLNLKRDRTRIGLSF